MPKNIKLDKCEEFIYKMISSRIRFQKKRYGMKNYEILPADMQLASNILNNKRSNKKNPYLITTSYFKYICDNLKFKSQSEMLWGSKEEFKTFGGHFFFLLIDEILSVQSPEKEFKKLQKCIISHLNDYAPYARISCYEDFKSTHKDMDEYFFNLITQSFDIDNLEEKITAYRNAVGRLYSMLADQFITSFLSFFKEKNTIKLNKKLNMYILDNFSEILQEKQEKSAYSIGMLVYDSLKTYYELTPSETELHFSQLGYYRTFTPETQEDVYDVLNDLRKANSDYIDKLIKIQTRLEFTSYEDYLVNNWDYHNFTSVEDI